jgi:hypothetical protein
MAAAATTPLSYNAYVQNLGVMEKNADNKFYVYEHWRSDTNVPFYVGKGRGSRSHTMHSQRNKLHMAIQEELKNIGATIEVRFVEREIDEETAFNGERSRIAFWRGQGVVLANLSIGGEGASGYKHTPDAIARTVAFHTGRKRSPETRARISAKAKGRKVSAERIEKMAIANRGKKRVFSAEHLAKISAASKGRKMPTHVMEALRTANANRSGWKHTPEAIAKMSAARKGKKSGPLSDAHRAAISAGNIGKPKSAAHCAAIAEGALHRRKKIK